MLAAFNVTKLLDLGYNETEFLDPVEPRWRAVTNTPDLFTTEAIIDRINFIASLGPYNDIIGAETALYDYWSAKGEDFVEGSVGKRAVAPGAGDRIKMRKLGSRKELAEILEKETSHSGKCDDDGEDDATTPVIGTNGTAVVGENKLRAKYMLGRAPSNGGSSGNSGGNSGGSDSCDDDDTTGDDDDTTGDDDDATGDDDN